jgi:alkanesulfonate monooxygenase SsuD/methylene tetrahydromethanopterin reductase-like flavin-dependent oxidoreductase (luciferase family)
MEIGVTFATSTEGVSGPKLSDGRPFREWIRDAERTMRVLERAGFSYLVVTHAYHLTWSQPFPLMARLAAGSGALRFSTEILQLPLLHPLDAASNITMIDHMTEGRLDVGLGIGFHPLELEAAGVTRRDRVGRFEEALTVMKKAWSGEPVHHAGVHFRVSGVQPTLRPFQRPHPRLIGSAQSHGAAVRAGRLLDGIVVGPQVGFEDVARLVQTCREEREKQGREGPGILGAWRTMIVGHDRAAAIKEGIAGGELTFKRYHEGAMQEKGMVRIHVELKEDTADDFAIAGGYRECLEGLRRCRDEIGLNRLTCRFYNLPRGVDARLEWLEGFGAEVIRRL